jgi:hypothetical protein
MAVGRPAADPVRHSALTVIAQRAAVGIMPTILSRIPTLLQHRNEGNSMPRPTSPRGPDRPEASAPSNRARSLAVIALVQLWLAACAADAWKPNPNFSVFLNQVERVCGTARIGEFTVSQLMNPASAQSSAYFVDMTSRLDLGRISEEDYVLGVSSTFNTERNSAGIRCILAQKTQ